MPTQTDTTAPDVLRRPPESINRVRRPMGASRRSTITRAAVAWALALVTMFPILWLVLGALKPANETFASGLPTSLSLDNVRYVLTEVPFPQYLFNSAIVSLTVTAAALLFHSMAAYAL